MTDNGDTNKLNLKIAQVKDQIEKNLVELNKALLSNELLFVQLATIAKKDNNPIKTVTPQISKEKQLKSVDDVKDINQVQIEFGASSKQHAQEALSNYSEDEDESEEEDEE